MNLASSVTDSDFSCIDGLATTIMSYSNYLGLSGVKINENIEKYKLFFNLLFIK